GGFNGGGHGGAFSYSEPTGGGGGASDIRIGTNSLFARVIVAGGGGRSWIKSWNGCNRRCWRSRTEEMVVEMAEEMIIDGQGVEERSSMEELQEWKVRLKRVLLE
ncbi:MAG: glycine rich domain-containing protein, partial [Oscillospiraceae bacterium]|nr:glycine rich domain-containing protein [Oscillospiraceae bacterium]